MLWQNDHCAILREMHWISNIYKKMTKKLLCGAQVVINKKCCQVNRS